MSLILLTLKVKLVIPSKTVSYKAMVLAAGRGERMRPLTDRLPKPLLKVGDHALIEYQLMSLASAGFTDIVINHAYLGEMIEDTLGSGERYGINIQYSPENTVLETAGGIANALPLLMDKVGDLPFLVVNADIYCKMDYSVLLPVLNAMRSAADQRVAHLVLVDNPPHHAEGDFALQNSQVMLTGDHRLTFSGIGIYQARLFSAVEPDTPVRMAPILRQAVQEGRVSGEYFSGQWVDVGTPDRLRLLDQQLSDRLE